MSDRKKFESEKEKIVVIVEKESTVEYKNGFFLIVVGPNARLSGWLGFKLKNI